MRKSTVVQIIARRLRIGAGRVEAIAQRLADHGLLARADASRRYPPDIDDAQISTLTLAVLTDQGLGNVMRSFETFGPLSTTEGFRFGDTLMRILRDPHPDVQSLVVRHDPPGVTLLAGGQHFLFGEQPSASASTKATIVPGQALACIGLETQGLSESEADQTVAIASLRRVLG